MNKILRFVLAVFMVLCIASTASADDITRNVIAKIPEDISSCLIGIRVYQNMGYIMGSNGKYITVDLSTGDVTSYKLEAEDILDFDVVVGKIIYLGSDGKIGGHAFPSWPKGPFNACRIDACDQGAILSGGANAIFLAKTATTTIEIPDMNICLPIAKGLIWTMEYGQDKRWEASLYDCFGNLMSNIYKFGEQFQPTNIEIGPEGMEGEMVVSAIESNTRTLALIANNGRMFWKINGPDKVCARDVAFDRDDHLVVLEENDKNEIQLTRLTFIIPEG